MQIRQLLPFLLIGLVLAELKCMEKCNKDPDCLFELQYCRSRYYLDLWILRCLKERAGTNKMVAEFISCQDISSDLVDCLPSSTDNSSYVIQTSYISSKINNTCGFFCGSYGSAKVCSTGCKSCTSSMNLQPWGSSATSYGFAVSQCFKKNFSCKNFEVRLGLVSFAAILIFLVFL